MSAPRRRRRSSPGAELRAYLVERIRPKVDKYRPFVVFEDGAVAVSPWPNLLARLEAGEPVTVPGYLLPADVRAEHGASGFFTVAADGTVEKVAQS